MRAVGQVPPAVGGRTRRRAPALAGLALALIIALSGCASIHSGRTTAASSRSTTMTTVRVKVVVAQGGSTTVLLPVTINGHGPYTFALDTGASVSLVEKSLARHLGLPVVGRGGTISGVASDERAYPVNVTNWHIEGLTLPSATVASANLFAGQSSQGLSGLIGSDIWRRFGTVEINYRAQTITVPRSAAAAFGVGAPLALAAGRVPCGG